MAKKEKVVKEQIKDEVDDLAAALIHDLNKELGTRVAYNLAESTAPTIVKRWLDTGSVLLNYAIANKPEGGYPEGRIIEITGLPSSGKSHLAYHAAAVTQKLGGLVVYIDSENATPLDKLKHMGIDVSKKFVYIDSHCTEEVFTVIESTITKAKQMSSIKDVPILVIWDSIAATSPKAELEGDYDQMTMGLQARVLSKGLRKITGVIGQNNVTLLLLNQLRDRISPGPGDPYVSPGGKGVPFFSSIRIRLGSGAPIKNKDGDVVGIHVNCTLKKNKLAPPFRKCEFDIMFGKGIVEHEFVFDELRSWCSSHGPAKLESGQLISMDGTGAWKTFTVKEPNGLILIEKKFHKAEFKEIWKDPEYEPFITELIKQALVKNFDDVELEDSEDSDDNGELDD